MRSAQPFEIHGPADAPPLLLIAPLGRDRTSWAMQIPAFAEAFRCIVYDARGTGEAAKAISETSIEEMARDALAVLTAAEIDQAHVAGWSMGAAVATSAALEAPARVRSLSLYTPWGRTDRWLGVAFRVLTDIARNRPLAEFEAAVTWLLLSRDFINSMDDFDAAMSATVDGPGYPAAETIVAQLEASIEHDVLDEASRITAPTFVVAGDRDGLIPVAYGAELAARIPSARLEVLEGPGSTHGLLVERSAEFNERALGFLHEAQRGP